MPSLPSRLARGGNLSVKAWFRKLSRFLSQLGFSLGDISGYFLLYKSLQSDRLRVKIGQDVAEYAVMLAVILVIVVGRSDGWKLWNFYSICSGYCW